MCRTKSRRDIYVCVCVYLVDEIMIKCFERIPCRLFWSRSKVRISLRFGDLVHAYCCTSATHPRYICTEVFSRVRCHLLDGINACQGTDLPVRHRLLPFCRHLVFCVRHDLDTGTVMGMAVTFPLPKATCGQGRRLYLSVALLPFGTTKTLRHLAQGMRSRFIHRRSIF